MKLYGAGRIESRPNSARSQSRRITPGETFEFKLAVSIHRVKR
jgi:hypothetical protein